MKGEETHEGASGAIGEEDQGGEGQEIGDHLYPDHGGWGEVDGLCFFGEEVEGDVVEEDDQADEGQAPEGLIPLKPEGLGEATEQDGEGGQPAETDEPSQLCSQEAVGVGGVGKGGGHDE